MPRKDDNPEWTDEDFAAATKLKPGMALIEATKVMVAKRGRPKPDDGKVTVRLCLDVDVIEAFKVEGPDWMDRMNDALREAMELKAAGAK